MALVYTTWHISTKIEYIRHVSWKNKIMIKDLNICLRVILVTMVLTGVIYPICVTVVAQIIFPHQAGGSLLVDSDGKPCGTRLLAQPLTASHYFQSRPSAASLTEAKWVVSGGSNWGTTSEKLSGAIQARHRSLLLENPDAEKEIPVELLTASGSGLDPHLSFAAAKWQIPRIAKARNVDAVHMERLLESRVEPRQFGILGEPRVNVLELNMALDKQFGPADARWTPLVFESANLKGQTTTPTDSDIRNQKN